MKFSIMIYDILSDHQMLVGGKVLISLLSSYRAYYLTVEAPIKQQTGHVRLLWYYYGTTGLDVTQTDTTIIILRCTLYHNLQQQYKYKEQSSILEKNIVTLHRQSSFHQHCHSLHNNLVQRTMLLTADGQKIHIHLPPPIIRNIMVCHTKDECLLDVHDR